MSSYCEEEGQADGLEDTSKCANGDGVQRTLLGGDLSDKLEAISQGTWQEKLRKHTEGAELARKIREPKYAAPL